MSDYYIGNGMKPPKEADYVKKYGWQGHTYYILDKAKYRQNHSAKKKLAEMDRKVRKEWREDHKKFMLDIKKEKKNNGNRKQKRN